MRVVRREAAELPELLGVGALERLGVLREHVVAVRDDRLQGLRVHRRLRLGEARGRRDLLHLGEAERLEQADVHPAEVDLVPLVGELRRGRVGVVVVMQLLAADEQAPGHDVGARVLRGPVAVAPEMADAVDHARRPERDPGDLRDEDQHARHGAEQHDVGGAHQGDAEHRETGVDVALEPVIRRAVAVTVHRLAVVGLFHVQEHAAPEHAVDSQLLRAVRVFRSFAFGVVLAVDRGPLLGHHSGRHPQPQAEEVTRERMQIERAVRLAAVQEHRDADDGHVSEAQGRENIAPPGKIENA